MPPHEADDEVSGGGADVLSGSPIGYYVHHHGAGHAARFANIAQVAGDSLVPISELDLPGGLTLPSDVVAGGHDPTAGGALHWAPIGDRQSARRSLIIGRWLHDEQPRGVVVDVSVEAALLCRLFGIATIVVRQHGDRTDAAHVAAYRSAAALMAPFPVGLEHDSTPEWVRQKTTYTGFIARSLPPSDQPGPEQPSGVRHQMAGDVLSDPPTSDDIVILWGTGGGSLHPRDIGDIVRSTASTRVWFVGTEPFDLDPTGVTSLGWIDDVPGVLRHRPTVIGSAGNNVVADAAAAGCALVVVPQDRPFDEQRRHAQSLDAARAAAVVLPGDVVDWRRAIEIARDRRSQLARLAADGEGARAAARLISRTFEASPED